jgi:hypothetical protein
VKVHRPRPDRRQRAPGEWASNAGPRSQALSPDSGLRVRTYVSVGSVDPRRASGPNTPQSVTWLQRSHRRVVRAANNGGHLRPWWRLFGRWRGVVGRLVSARDPARGSVGHPLMRWVARRYVPSAGGPPVAVLARGAFSGPPRPARHHIELTDAGVQHHPRSQPDQASLDNAERSIGCNSARIAGGRHVFETCSIRRLPARGPDRLVTCRVLLSDDAQPGAQLRGPGRGTAILADVDDGVSALGAQLVSADQLPAERD